MTTDFENIVATIPNDPPDSMRWDLTDGKIYPWVAIECLGHWVKVLHNSYGFEWWYTHGEYVKTTAEIPDNYNDFAREATSIVYKYRV